MSKKTVRFAEPTVMVASYSQPNPELRDILGEVNVPALQVVPEFAGRACYQSWDKPNPATATNAGYLANIIKQKHFSVIEHSSIGFYIQGVSRSLTHELVRHRHFSYSQLSQRYVDSSDVGFVLPPDFEGDDEAIEVFRADCEDRLEMYQWFQDHQAKKGLGKKATRQSARSVLPNATETKLVMTGNLRAWMEFMVKRDNPAADVEIQRLARMIGLHLGTLAPSVFGSEARPLWDEFLREAAQHEARQ
ncbi:ThyX-like thymidylate synthase [Gordonia phage RedWattleHog]|uniref:ThyX-like thymidylate synthase n=1 Tax=Gordonia phage Stormageddon TaxID=2656541 RepID=A0A649VSR2_9CAUD|nr:thymidylate synthase [Gordonia phage Stormageddon]QGJ95045.1 ThyX-like thymidylate synthase [Gordonia phage Stormageddon]QLF83687.1 ThyX-like thymidylate synthase [Gordonia phage RedWattleHog]